MICINRDPAFWDAVASHPEVAPHMLFDIERSFEDILSLQSVTPIGSRHGGFIVVRLDHPGRVYEVHTLFTPAGWGKEVATAAREALTFMFSAGGADLLTTLEVEGNWRSAPPRSFGWTECGDFKPFALGRAAKLWSITSKAWFGSPVRKRELRRCQ